MKTKPSELVRKGFCKEFLSVDENGNPVDPLVGVKWCVLGAIRVTIHTLSERNQYITRLENLIIEREGRFVEITKWNDSHEQSEVIDMLEKVEKKLDSNKS